MLLPGGNWPQLFQMTNRQDVPLLLALACVLCYAPDTRADPRSFNGLWTLNEAESQTFEDAGKERNKESLRKRRIKHGKELDAAETEFARGHGIELLRKDQRPRPWSATGGVGEMLETESIKLYYGRKIAILYGAQRRRLLALNPGGRAFSLSGSTVTKDDIGDSIAFLDDRTIVIETDTRWGDKLVERFELNDTSEHLLVTVRMQQIPQGPWLEYVRVFDRAD